MKSKGFTLIELLAVIVILAIIALIAVPIILNIIDSTKDSANQRSVELYGSAVEKAVAKEQLNGEEINAGDLSREFLDTVQYNGSRVECETNKLYPNGGIYLSGCKVDNKDVSYTYGKEQIKTYANGEVVYFNVTTGAKCTEADYTSNTDKEGKTGCMKFYAFNDSEVSLTVNLLLDHNTTANVEWNSNRGWPNEGEQGPVTLLEQLKEDTSAWVGVETPENYSFKGNGIMCEDPDDVWNTTEGEFSYTIDYSEYKARLITSEEIREITGHTEWNDVFNYGYYYFDSKTEVESATCKKGNTRGCAYGWLYDRTSKDCTDYGCNNNSTDETYGYWTSSSNPDVSFFAFAVYFDAMMEGSDSKDTSGVASTMAGARPVITISKSLIG